MSKFDWAEFSMSVLFTEGFIFPVFVLALFYIRYIALWHVQLTLTDRERRDGDRRDGDREFRGRDDGDDKTLGDWRRKEDVGGRDRRGV